MRLKAAYFKKVFEFNFNARTSRGAMQHKISWFVKLWYENEPEVFGIGECGPLPGLSLDDTVDFEQVLSSIVREINTTGENPVEHHGHKKRAEKYLTSPSITFGLETAWLDLKHGGRRIIFQNDFILGKPIPINGLIWMDGAAKMLEQVEKKIKSGFSCIKLKIGGLDFERECEILRAIRSQYSPERITIRLDANGAFAVDEAWAKLRRLSEYDIHSIEQPIAENQANEMRNLCKNSPIPVALDEELIRHQHLEGKRELLSTLRPAFIILKPTLHGGFSGCDEWISLAEEMGIGWWITSALESNVGLNAICQYTAKFSITLPQGLGTGSIYQNNIESPLAVSDGQIFQDKSRRWSFETFAPEI
ncbi:MAG TPA: o-succinylbenzoate synthase [Chryseolinea sp.]